MLGRNIKGRILVLLTSVTIPSCVPTVSHAAEQWAWFRAVSAEDPVKWWLVQGVAEVTISERKFEALLRDSSSPRDLVLTLRGTASGGTVKVQVTTHGTDAPNYDVSGTLKRLCWDDGGGREILILTDGVNAIGLVRELSVGVPCKRA